MSILPTWPIAAGALALGLAGGAYVDHKIMQGRIDKITIEHAKVEQERMVQRTRDEVAARENERILVERANQIEQGKIDEIARINDRHAAAIASLQQRPERKPANPGGVPTAGSTCQGSTGAELSRQDGGFLAGEAARADELRTALGACYKAYDSLR